MFPMGHGGRTRIVSGFACPSNAECSPLQVTNGCAYADVVGVHHTSYYGMLNGLAEVIPKSKKFHYPSDWRKVLLETNHGSMEDYVLHLTELLNSPLSLVSENIFFEKDEEGEWHISVRVKKPFFSMGRFGSMPDWIIERTEVCGYGRQIHGEVGMRLFAPMVQ